VNWTKLISADFSSAFTTLQPRGLFLVGFFFEKSRSNIVGIYQSTPRTLFENDPQNSNSEWSSGNREILSASKFDAATGVRRKNQKQPKNLSTRWGIEKCLQFEIWWCERRGYDDVQKPKSKLKFVTIDKESNMSTLCQWRREEFLRICSKEELAEKATGYRGDNTCQKKSRDTVQPRSRVFLRKSFLGQATGWGRNQ